MGKKEKKEIFDRLRVLENTNTGILKTLEVIEKNTSSFEKKFSEHDDKEMAKYDIYDKHQQELSKNISELNATVTAFTGKVDEMMKANSKLDSKVNEHKENTDRKIESLEKDMINGFGDINVKLESIWGKIKSFTLVATVVIILLGSGWSLFKFLDEKYTTERQVLLSEIKELKNAK